MFYNIVASPVSILDGTPDAQDRPISTWGATSYGTRSLSLAQADVKVTPTISTIPDGKISVKVDVTAIFDLPANTILHVAILEAHTPLSSLSTAQRAMVKTGETEFFYTLKKMLPTAGGTKLGTAMAPNEIRSFSTGLEWKLDAAKLYPDPNDIIVVAFLQNETTREVYQVNYSSYQNDPGVITGVEPIAAENIEVYPNPASLEMNILMPGKLQHAAPLQLFDQTGRVVLEGSIPENTNLKKISTSDLASGLYILQINIGNGNFTRKKVLIVH
ncbi:MAG: T9SS type A sorting domain-containing protein [Bacteroidota bacterium]